MFDQLYKTLISIARVAPEWCRVRQRGNVPAE